MKNRKIAISDIHGCLKTFRQLLEEKVQFTKQDTLYLLGDYIDRGPDSKGVIDYILQLQSEKFNVICLKGNHEEMLLKALEYKFHQNIFLRNGGEQTLQSYGYTRVEELRNHPHIAFFKNLFYYLELDNYYLVHAGFDFRAHSPFYLTKPMLWIRNWHHQIDRTKLDGKIIVHGHTPQTVKSIKAMKHNMAISQYMNIDAGCFGYKKMCALDLTNRVLYFQDSLDEVEF